jgi:hypothetical protein
MFSFIISAYYTSKVQSVANVSKSVLPKCFLDRMSCRKPILNFHSQQRKLKKDAIDYYFCWLKSTQLINGLTHGGL